MAINIPSANVSPRNDNGILKFYEGDTFEFDLCLDLKDQDDKDIVLDGTKDTVTITFYDRKNKVVKEYGFGKGKDNAIASGNVLKIIFDQEAASLFVKGTYTYEGIVEIPGIGRRTVIHNAPVLVE